MQILVLCERLDLNHTSSGVGRSKLLKCLGKSGNQIKCIYDQNQETKKLMIEGVEMARLNKSDRGFWDMLAKYSRLSAALHYLTGFNAEFRALKKKWEVSIEDELAHNSYKAVFILGTGQRLVTFFAFYKFRNRIPFILNFHDPYPEAFHPAFRTRLDFPHKIRINIVKQLVSRAFAVTSPSKGLLNLLSSYYPIDKKGLVIPHPGINQNVFVEKRKQNELVISHTGLLFGSRNPSCLLKALNELLDDGRIPRKEIRLELIGPCTISDDNFLFELTKLDSVVKFVNRRVSYDESLKIQSDAHVLLLVDFKGESPIMPGKLADYFSMNKPILALTPNSSETSRLLGENYPFKASIEDTVKIKKILLELYNSWKEGKLELVDLSKQRQYVSCENVVNKFNDALLDIKFD